MNGGVGYTPLTFSNFKAHSDYVLTIDGKPLDQSIHGNDFWQSDYDVETGTWSRTYNLPVTDRDLHRISLKRER